MGCKQCSHLLGSDDVESNSQSTDRGRRDSARAGGRNRNYSSGNVNNPNGLSDISEESSSACNTSQQSS